MEKEESRELHDKTNEQEILARAKVSVDLFNEVLQSSSVPRLDGS